MAGVPGPYAGGFHGMAEPALPIPAVRLPAV